METRYDITLVTYAGFPSLTDDDRLLQAALERRGVAVRAAVWDDPAIDWSRSPVTMMRSMWDYFYAPERFERWLTRVVTQTRLVNSAKLARWNMHKRYLLELESRGVAIVPTTVVPRGTDLADVRLPDVEGGDAVVIKPAIAGSAYGARRFEAGADRTEAYAHVEMLAARGDVLIQPYIASVETAGERSLMYVDGAFSHAVIKAPFSAGAAAGEHLERAVLPSREELGAAARTLSVLPEAPHYARVDIVPVDGRSLVMEVELIEPSLYLASDPGSADRVAAATMRILEPVSF